ncbi:MAG: hypothetical protein D6834_01760 [Aquificota bacterium]|nr:MAG: hypothetical protein D6834_01760 [Aquificota bacterium]
MFSSKLKDELEKKKEMEIFSILAKVVNELLFKNTKPYIRLSEHRHIYLHLEYINDFEKKYLSQLCLKRYKEIEKNEDKKTHIKINV